MKNPYVYGFLPFVTVLLFSLTFGLYAMDQLILLAKRVNVYRGLEEFLTAFQIRLFLLTATALFFFLLFSALRLLAVTIHETAMLLFAKDEEGRALSQGRGAQLLFFFGAVLSIVGMRSPLLLAFIFIASAILSFAYFLYKISFAFTASGLLGIVLFEVTAWGLLAGSAALAAFKLYNGLLEGLPFLKGTA